MTVKSGQKGCRYWQAICQIKLGLCGTLATLSADANAAHTSSRQQWPKVRKPTLSNGQTKPSLATRCGQEAKWAAEGQTGRGIECDRSNCSGLLPRISLDFFFCHNLKAHSFNTLLVFMSPPFDWPVTVIHSSKLAILLVPLRFISRGSTGQCRQKHSFTQLDQAENLRHSDWLYWYSSTCHKSTWRGQARRYTD